MARRRVPVRWKTEGTDPAAPRPSVRRGGRVVRQGPAKPPTPVRFRSPPRDPLACGPRALSSGGERFLDAEEVRGSNPLAPTGDALQKSASRLLSGFGEALAVVSSKSCGRPAARRRLPTASRRRGPPANSKSRLSKEPGLAGSDSVSDRWAGYTHVQWTSASWHPAHLNVQYRSEPTWRCPASCSPATDPQIAHFQPSADPPHFAHSRLSACPISRSSRPSCLR
jgi:hypothetical protein